MFHKKLIRRIESLESSVNRIDSRDDQWSLRCRIRHLENELTLLVQALRLVRKVTNKVEYVQKGGPEKEEES